MIMELRLLPPDLLKQKECTEVLNDYIASFRFFVITYFCILVMKSQQRTCHLSQVVLALNLYFSKSLCPSRDMVTYERETGDVLERFNESLNVVRVKLNINVDSHIKMLSDYNSI